MVACNFYFTYRETHYAQNPCDTARGRGQVQREVLVVETPHIKDGHMEEN